MSTLENHNWEEHWREEVDQYTPPPNAVDWAGMSQLLDGASAPQGHRIIDEDIPTQATRSPWQLLSQISWNQWLLLTITVLGLGYWLGISQSALITQEMDDAYQKVDTIPGLNFPPNYRVNEYYTYDEDGQRSVVQLRDTTFFSQRIVRRAPRNYTTTTIDEKLVYVDTVYTLGAKGNLHVRYDSVYSNGVSIRSIPARDGEEGEHSNAHQPAKGDLADGPSPAFVPSSAPAAPPTIFPSVTQDTSGGEAPTPVPEKTSTSITLGVIVEPLPIHSIPLGADYWSYHVEELLKSGRLKVQRISLENGHFPPIRQRF
jgi:hypothetical protein